MCFWGCCKWSGQAHRDCNIIYQFLWGYVQPYQDSFNRGSLQNSDSSVRPKKMLTERGIKSCINRPNTHWKKRSEWQRGIIIKLMKKISSSVSASVWKGMKDITNYKTPSPRTVENRQLADELNEFYCRFENTPHTPEHLSTHPLAPPSTPLSPTPALTISEDDVCQVFRENKRRKAPGSDGVSPACFKTCADQPAPIFTKIFNGSLELCEVPSCFKCSTIIPVTKKPKTTGLNDYRHVALTSVVMKSFERLVLAYMKASTGPLLDPLQFAYRANISVDDASTWDCTSSCSIWTDQGLLWGSCL